MTLPFATEKLVKSFTRFAVASSSHFRICQNQTMRSRFSHISFLPHGAASLKSLQDRISGSMPPKSDKGSKGNDTSRDKGDRTSQDKFEFPEAQFKAMLLSALRTDEDVRAAVAHILRSRETDVFSAVVQCLDRDQVRHRIGMFMILLF